MTDAELIAYLHLSPAEAMMVLPRITPEKRALYARMKEVEIEAALWLEGLGPKPKGVLLDLDRDTRRRQRRGRL